jgi:hypothetical protein
VERVHLLPLVELEHAQAPRLLSIEESTHPVIQMPVEGLWIHAPTAAFLYQFREVVLHGRPTRVAQFEQPPEWWNGLTSLSDLKSGSRVQQRLPRPQGGS